MQIKLDHTNWTGTAKKLGMAGGRCGEGPQGARDRSERDADSRRARHPEHTLSYQCRVMMTLAARCSC
eukprot:363333-Chlamydomonas_euryale.AAC.1